MMLVPVAMATAPKHEVSVWISRNIAPSSKVRVSLNTRNVPSVHVTARPIDGAAWLVRSEEARTKRPETTGAPVRTWDLSVVGKDQKPNPNGADTYYSRQVNLPPMRPGVYLLDFGGGDKPAWAVVNVTDLAVLVKRSPNRALVWVTDFATGKVVPNAEVTAYRPNGGAVLSARTGSDGAALVGLRPGDETFVVRRGNDLAGVPTSQSNPDGVLRAHFQTDRPIYRPGQRISYKAIVRRTLGQGYSVVGNRPVTVQLRDPKDNALDEKTLTTNAMGSVAGEFEIPEEGATGPYTLVVTQGKETAYTTVTVAAYRKPEFKVDVRALPGTTNGRYLAGDEIAFRVDAAYYFGAPVPGATVRYTIRRTGLGFTPRDPSEGWFYSGDGNLYARDTYTSDAVVAEDTAYTDNDGGVTIRLKSDRNQGDATYAIACEVTDGSRRQVSGGGSVPVYGAAVRLGLTTPLVYATLGSLVPVTVRAVDLDGKPTAATVTLTMRTPYYDAKGEWREKVLTRTTIKVPASGVATMNLPTKEEGQIKIEAETKDRTGHLARANLSVYVAGNYEKPRKEREQPTISVMLDKRVYAPGDGARAFVQTNNPQFPVLLVAEGGDIWSYKVLPNPGAARTWTVATNARLSPNAYVAAEQWVKGQLVSANVLLPIPDRTKALKVEAVPDKPEYRPGEKATYAIRTTDGGGKPVAAEVALSVVDEAIFALSPDSTADPYGFYWGLRPNGVTMQGSAPEEIAGGAYQRVSTVAPVRQRFEDTAFWGPTVATDASGRASVTFEMPGNLTAWRATARGITMGTSVGVGTSTVRANRPVTLRLATPRQMVAGDRVRLIGTVNNRTDASREFETEIAGEGIAVEGERRRKITVPARSEGKIEWALRADTIPTTGTGELTAQVFEAGNRDPENADALKVGIPIVPNGLPERTLVGGTVRREAKTTLTLPADRIEPASVVTLDVRAGLRPLLRETADSVLTNPRYGSVGAANQLDVAAATGVRGDAKPVRESLALLSRVGRYDGWGLWESAPTDPIVTARVASALGAAKASGARVFDNLLATARGAVAERYNATNLWEHRAQLAAAAAMIGHEKAKDLVAEVQARGQGMSPYARLRLAEGLLVLEKRDDAEALVRAVLKDAPSGDAATFIPRGEGTEWSATDTETTAQALVVLARLGIERDTQTRLARWLASPENGWRSSDENAALVRALAFYLGRANEGERLGTVTVEVNGTAVPAVASTVADSVSARIPRELLKDGANAIVIRRAGSEGEAFTTVDARVYRPVTAESTEGVRVLRRFEVKNAGGTWVELDRPVRTGEPVRCTAVAWGDDIRDAVKVVEPIPAGFEFTEDESGSEGSQEVRDGAVVHYLTNSGLPQTFRYYLRAETEGTLVALPATAEYLRRPRMRGNSVPVKVEVRAEEKADQKTAKGEGKAAK